ncbi:cytochrome c biogenesis protein ResB, partial [bacterium]|nr:cytochrome c biogenesis protein ResB [bacterium]
FTANIMGKPVYLETPNCKSLMIQAVRYEPDFIMAGPERIGSRSIQPNNPAVLIQVKCGEEKPESQWLFLNHKTVHTSVLEAGLTIQFDSVNQQYDTGLEVVRDPGSPWVAVGALLLVAGLCLYMTSMKKMGVKNN